MSALHLRLLSSSRLARPVVARITGLLALGLFTLGLVASTLLLGPRAEAQAVARPTGAVAGLDLQIEGAYQGVQGGELRWLVTSYEVRGASTLALAPGADVEWTTSLDRSAEPVTTRTDAHGRALVRVPIPLDAPSSFQVVLRVSRGGASRRFELSVGAFPAAELEIVPIGASVAPEGRLAFSVVMRDASQRALAGQPLRVEVLDASRRRILPLIELTTNASGVAHHAVRLARGVTGRVTLRAVSGEGRRRVEAEREVEVVAPHGSGALLVAVVPERWVLASGETTDVTVLVRNEAGRPIEGALVDADEVRTPEQRRQAPLRTDAHGRARYALRAPLTSEAFFDFATYVRVSHETEGSGSSGVTLRVGAAPRVVSFAVEGGALLPALGGRVYVRAVELDGSPSPAGLEVSVSGPRLGTHRARTDASGLASIELPPLAGLGAGVEDRCAGDGATTAITVSVADAAPIVSCVALDAEATVRVRVGSPIAVPGEPLEIELARAPHAARLPISVRLVVEESHALLDATVVDASESRATLRLPPNTPAERIAIVARALVGAEQREVMGGVVSVLARRRRMPALDVRVERGDRGAIVHLPRLGDASALVFALPLEDALAYLPDDDELSPGATESGQTDAMLEAMLAATVARDVNAPFVLRESGGRLETVPVPSPEGESLFLRDPWRTQARFVSGRLALLFRAIERRVASAVPGAIDDVAVETNGRWDFNAQIVESVADGGELGGEGATNLGGEPITVEALRALDPAFSYDNVARRVTRERLFRLLVLLRRFILANGYDIPWARFGDPSSWLARLASTSDPAIGSVGPQVLVDGWGRPFVLRQVRGRARHLAWEPLPGWEIASLGPDGRGGTSDDLVDPSARILPSASLYAQAVGEDVLLARLNGVALGRATIEALGNNLGIGSMTIPPDADRERRSSALERWREVPTPFLRPLDPFALKRPTRVADSASTLVELDGSDVTLPLDEEPRTWGIVTFVTTTAGVASVAVRPLLFGSSLIIEGELPRRVRVGEPIDVELRVTNLEARPRSLVAESTVGDALGLAQPGSLDVPAEAATTFVVRLEGRAPGEASAELRWMEGERVARTLRSRHAIDRGLHPIRTRATLASASAERVELSLEPGAPVRDTSARVVVLRPSALGLDPDLGRLREDDPGLVAWALAMGGRPLDARLRARLERRGAEGASRLSQACALVAFSSLDVEDEGAMARAAELRAALAGSPSSSTDSAAVVAALASGGIFELADAYERSVDPVAMTLSRERGRLRRWLVRSPDEPSLLARASAALLLADSGDAYGRAMFDRVRGHLERVERGGREGLVVVPSSAMDAPLERLTASLALSIAARRLGEAELAEALVRGASFDENVVIHAGGESAFFWLAAGAYGALGGEPSPGAGDAVTLEVDGRARSVSLANGVAVIPIEGASARPSIAVRGAGPLYVRAELLGYAPFAPRADAPLTLSIEGEEGDATHLSTLELSVRADEALRAPILEIQIPAGARVDDAFLAAMSARAPVRAAELRAPGVLHVELGPLASGTETHIPLTFSWMARGSVRGLAVVAFEADAPSRMTVLAPRTLEIP